MELKKIELIRYLGLRFEVKTLISATCVINLVNILM